MSPADHWTLTREDAMRHGIWIGLLAIATGLGAGPGRGGPAAASFPRPVRRTTLDNGVPGISVPCGSPGIIAYHPVGRAGSRNEVEARLSGVAHLFEHMMFRGTERYAQQKYND